METNLYTTMIQALCARTGVMTTWCGPHVPGINFKDAQDYCDNNGLGYCKVDGILVEEIPCKEGTYDPDWDEMVDYSRDN